jgi:hypothetical protein
MEVKKPLPAAVAAPVDCGISVRAVMRVVLDDRLGY